MKAYGYSSTVDMGKGPIPLDEILIWGEPEVLRELAKFIDLMANEIKCNPNFDNMHLRDAWEKWTEGCPDFIICKPE
jgi:hypothetical protein